MTKIMLMLVAASALIATVALWPTIFPNQHSFVRLSWSHYSSHGASESRGEHVPSSHHYSRA